jgi:hypothetical protein
LSDGKTIYWTVAYQDRAIRAGIYSDPDTKSVADFAASQTESYARHHWEPRGSHGSAKTYYRKTANGNQWLVAGIYRQHHYVTVRTTQTPFGTLPVLWDVPLNQHTAKYDQLLTKIDTKCQAK